MKAETARKLAIGVSQMMERWDHWSYADALADFDNNEELLLEDLVKQITVSPEVTIGMLLETMDCMLEEMEM